jgi:hypothetical protein
VARRKHSRENISQYQNPTWPPPAYSPQLPRRRCQAGPTRRSSLSCACAAHRPMRSGRPPTAIKPLPRHPPPPHRSRGWLLLPFRFGSGSGSGPRVASLA